LKAADIQPTDHVPVIGAGMGYGCALISFFVPRVPGIDNDAQMITYARQILEAENLSSRDQPTLKPLALIPRNRFSQWLAKGGCPL